MPTTSLLDPSIAVNTTSSDDMFRMIAAPSLHSGIPCPPSWEHGLAESDLGDRVLTRATGEALLERIVAMTTGGGETQITVRSSWVGNLRWGRNRPTTSGITMEPKVTIRRFINGAISSMTTNQWDDASLKAAVLRAEQHLNQTPLTLLGRQEYLAAPIWNAATADLTSQVRSAAAQASVLPVVDAKLVAAGYVATNIETWGIYNTQGLRAYAAATGALFSVNVRDPAGNGSGWAGRDHTDWARLDVAQLAADAMAHCVASANPKAIEPGRYTTILAPYAVGALMLHAVIEMDRQQAENNPDSPYGLAQGQSKIGLKVFDERLSIRTDPTDPDDAYIPFDGAGYPYRPVTWVERGILKELPYNRVYAQRTLMSDVPMPNPLACRVMNHGPVISMDEMIATTERGILLSRFGRMDLEDSNSLLVHSVTRDGLWLIEKGKIRMPIKNMYILESPMFVFNNVVQIGQPERTFGRHWSGTGDDMPPMSLNGGMAPLVMPPMKVQDFNFMMLTDAV